MYSIIIPHKNIYDLLVRCIDSIPKSLDCQIIVVDDQSNPEVKEKIKKLPSLDSRIEYHETTGKGAGEARNIGISYARGEWILFVDSDDIFTSDAFEILNKHSESNADIVYFGVESAFCSTLMPANRHTHKKQNINRFIKYPNKLKKWLRYEYTEPWGKLIKTAFIKTNNIKFYESIVANDYLFSITSGHIAKEIDYDQRAIYCVTVREHSLCNNMFDSESKILARIQAYHQVQTFFTENNIKLYPCSIFTLKILFKNPIQFSRMIPEIKKFGISNTDIFFLFPLDCFRIIPKKIFEFLKIPILGY